MFLNILMEYIQNLANNYPHEKDPNKKINLVLEGGALNGAFQLGGLLLIKEFEKRKHFKIDKISGCSVGSLMAFYYFFDILEDFIVDFSKLRKIFKEKIIYDIKSILKEKIKKIKKTDFEKVKRGKIFIVYYDMEKKEKVVKSEYKNKKDLMDTVLKSCHLPFLLNSEIYLKIKNKLFFDGGTPYIFPERELSDDKIMYMTTLNFAKMKQMFSAKHEKNIYGRMLEGALDTYKFFMYKNRTEMCSYVQKWKFRDFLIVRTQELLFKCIVYVFYIVFMIEKKLRPYVKDNESYKEICCIVKHIYNDFFLFYCI
jgi:hypothetical protein